MSYSSSEIFFCSSAFVDVNYAADVVVLTRIIGSSPTETMEALYLDLLCIILPFYESPFDKS